MNSSMLSRRRPVAARWAALACVAAAGLAAVPTAPHAHEGHDARRVAVVAPRAGEPARAAAPATVRGRDDEGPAAPVATAREATPNYGALGLALLALVLWVGMRLRRHD
ncbi:MAG TPA: hypothetical protein VLI72_05460 [Methylibium sp.]|nr:hypothetical protein [Methylibium sp.]